MAIDITADVTCDMCKRTESVKIKESWRWGRLESDPASVVDSLGRHWEVLDRDGHRVHDHRLGDTRILCEGCAARYVDAIKAKAAAIDALFDS